MYFAIIFFKRIIFLLLFNLHCCNTIFLYLLYNNNGIINQKLCNTIEIYSKFKSIGRSKVIDKNNSFERYKRLVRVSNKEIVTMLDNPFGLISVRDRDISQLFGRVVERINKNHRKSNQTVVEQINKVTGFNVNRFNKLLTVNVEFVPNNDEIRILEWLLSNEIDDFTENLKINYE